jgi:xylulokinase
MVAIDTDRNICWQGECTYGDPLALPKAWETALAELLTAARKDVCSRVRRIGIAGTSATVMAVNLKGQAIDPVLRYDDPRSAIVLPQIREILPADSIANSASSSFAKLWWLREELKGSQGKGKYEKVAHFLHHTDYIAFLLHGGLGESDYHNTLKLGYDPEKLRYADWLEALPERDWLPRIYPPGIPIAAIRKEIAKKYGFPENCWICMGTTDSIAAFIASGAQKLGDATTSLGSTLAVKLLHERPVNDTASGIYSHRYGNYWLVGGASNSGGNVLRAYFTDKELTELSDRIDPDKPSNLDYYPLLKPGERFPYNDPNLLPKISPIPESRVEFLHGLLEGIARIEAAGYRRLADLGSPYPQRVFTAGGGAKNATWMRIRSRHLGVPVTTATHTDAAYGSAILALQGGFHS